jgi:hypothetical protein
MALTFNEITISCARVDQWTDNIKIGILWMECVSVDWIELIQGRIKWHAVANMVMNLQVTQKQEIC